MKAAWNIYCFLIIWALLRLNCVVSHGNFLVSVNFIKFLQYIAVRCPSRGDDAREKRFLPVANEI